MLSVLILRVLSKTMDSVDNSVTKSTHPVTDDEERAEYHLHTYTNTGAAEGVFCPFNFSPVCTDRLCNFRDAELLAMTEGCA